jgi:hypothetical protein
LDGVQPHTAAGAGDDDSVSGSNAHPNDEGVKRGTDRVGENRSFGESDRCGYSHEISLRDDNELGIPSWDVHAHMPAEVLTDGFPTSQTPPTSTTHEIQTRTHTVSCGPPTNVGADRGHLAGDLVPENVREWGTLPAA